ncbi:PREDICTED: structure-specific endonuclease subunit slx1 [Ceratosolen solmsi marchali]|uniref:Structure-specific endonuclease subunit SLX1 homolog n=1 Tax=Ceratosolen solmsi marchali TaxID=326594 RepID=A0AAJ6YHV4_9HYME|nr:PREDICTED: structure-specific endonuclease subunit slx1 [Ceratosolen solmsi marchali]
METEQISEHFFGVYLLYCKNPNYKGKTYIGYTVNPKRRIKQHNAGKNFGGAWKTSNRGPWEMILIVHGFPNSICALQFEWAWQHPEHSRRLNHVIKKKSRQRTFNYQLMVLSAMLNVVPWVRLPLILRWLDDDFGREYSSWVRPPLHMPIAYGKITSKPLKNAHEGSQKSKEMEIPVNKVTNMDETYCQICLSMVEEEDAITCVEPNCSLISHLICLAEHFRKDDMILPIEGCCPACNVDILWGDLIRKKLGCTMHFDEENDESYFSDI